jgi:Tfp pilus assembly protein PilZ
MRKYIRHSSTVPIYYDLIDIAAKRKDSLKNVSLGGLCFESKHSVEQGTMLLIQIPLTTPTFQERGIVVWCQPSNSHYDVGVQFTNNESSFRIRMIEQVCYIENYKREVLEKEGRELSGEEAAVEWITKYARDFPRS